MVLLTLLICFDLDDWSQISSSYKFLLAFSVLQLGTLADNTLENVLFCGFPLDRAANALRNLRVFLSSAWMSYSFSAFFDALVRGSRNWVRVIPFASQHNYTLCRALLYRLI